MTWRSLSKFFPDVNRQAMQRQLRLSQAYRAVFHGSPSREDQELVLADLTNVSGWQKVMPSTATDAELRMQEGMRCLFGHVFSFLSLNPADIAGLENAARQEAAVEYRT